MTILPKFHMELGKRLFLSSHLDTDVCAKWRSWRIGEDWQIKATVMVLPSPGSVVWALDCCEVNRNYKWKSNFSLGRNCWTLQSSKGSWRTIRALPSYPCFLWSLASCHITSANPSYCHLCQNHVLFLSLTIGKHLSGPKTEDFRFGLELCRWSQWRSNSIQLLAVFP